MGQPDDARPPSLGPVLLVNFIGTLGYTIAIPFLVFLVTRFGGDAFVYGLVASTYSAFQFIGSPVLGRWSDRFGRRKILLVTQTGTLLSWLIFGLALYMPVTDVIPLGSVVLTLPLLIIIAARALDGLTGGNISVANAYVADISNEDNRSKNFGRMGVASNMGMVLGPALASVLGGTSLGEALPIFTAAGISLVGLVFIAFALPKSVRCIHKHHGRQDSVRSQGMEMRDCVQTLKQQKHGTWWLLHQPGVAFVVSLNFIIMAGFSFFYIAFPINAVQRLSWEVGQMGLFFTGLSVMLVLVQGPVLSFLSKRVNERVLISSGLASLSFAFVAMRSEHLSWLVVAAALFALGNGLMWPSMVAMIARVAGKELQGAVQGLSGSAGSLASIVGLVSGGLLYAQVAESTFLVSTGLMVVAFVLSLGLKRMVQ